MTRLLDQLGLRIPIVQAPMAGVSTPRMAAAVTRAGALGSIAIGAVDTATAHGMIETAQRDAGGPLNVNVFCHRPARRDPGRERAWLDALRVVFVRYGAEPPPSIREIYTSFVDDARTQELLLDLAPAAVSFHFGLPESALIARLKQRGIVTLSTATSLAEAELARNAGVDAIVAQGYEAGGHRGVFDPDASDARLGVLPLTRLLAVRLPLPIIAAGGIMDGAGAAAALKLGAVAVQIGTAFVACPESAADDAYRAALAGPGALETLMTRVVSGRPARSLPNAMTALEREVLAGVALPAYPIAYDASKSLSSIAKKKGEFGFAAQWAGQGAPLARPMPAGELVATISDEIAATLAP